AAGAVVHLRLVGLRIDDELSEVARGEILAHDEEQRLLDDQGDRREVGCGVVERVLVQRLVDRMGARAAEHELIAVRRSFGYAGCSGHAAGAADVLDDNGAPKTVGKPRTEDTAEDVERAPGREG